jgi:hypothetical protein
LSKMRPSTQSTLRILRHFFSAASAAFALNVISISESPPYVM